MFSAKVMSNSTYYTTSKRYLFIFLFRGNPGQKVLDAFLR